MRRFDLVRIFADFPGRVVMAVLFLPLGARRVNIPPRFPAMHTAFHDHLIPFSQPEPRQRRACDCIRTPALAGGRHPAVVGSSRRGRKCISMI